MADDDQRLNQLKQKYQSVLTAIQTQGIQLEHLNVQDNKLFLQGKAPSEQAKNNVWNAIKAVDPTYSDLTADFDVDAPAAAAAPTSDPSVKEQTYTVKAGDSLSKISQEFYGHANAYQKIFEANRDQLSDSDHIRAGQTLKIPV
jgi:nucleoid-associated protein YgaU